MNNLDDLYLLKPVNKTASLVSSQSGCSDSYVKDEQGLIDALKGIELKIVSLKKGSDERRKLGAKKAELANKLSNIRAERGCKKDDIQKLYLMAFMSIAKRELPDYKFKSIKVMAERYANDRLKSNQ